MIWTSKLNRNFKLSTWTHTHLLLICFPFSIFFGFENNSGISLVPSRVSQIHNRPFGSLSLNN